MASKVKVYNCERCGHEWAARGKYKVSKPRLCPHCHSAYWDIERTMKRKG